MKPFLLLCFVIAISACSGEDSPVYQENVQQEPKNLPGLTPEVDEPESFTVTDTTTTWTTASKPLNNAENGNGASMYFFFPEQNAAVSVVLNTDNVIVTGGDSLNISYTPQVTIHKFTSGISLSDMQNWAENRHSGSATDTNPASTEQALDLTLSFSASTLSQPGGATNIVTVDYSLSDYSDSEFELTGFSGSLDIAFTVSPPVTDTRVLDINDPEVIALSNNFNWQTFTKAEYTEIFYLFKEQKATLKILIDGINYNETEQFDVTTQLFLFDEQEDKSIEAWAKNQISNTQTDNPANPVSRTNLGNNKILITGIEHVNKAQDARYDVYSVDFTMADTTIGNTQINGFTTNTGVNVINYRDFDYILDTDIEHVKVRYNNVNWSTFSIAEYSEIYYIFEEEKAVLKVLIESTQTADGVEFTPSATVYLFSRTGGGSLEAWANNQYSDGLMLDAATPYNSISIDPKFIAISEFKPIEKQDSDNRFDFYTVDFSFTKTLAEKHTPVNDTADELYDAAIIKAFSDSTEVPVLKY